MKLSSHLIELLIEEVKQETINSLTNEIDEKLLKFYFYAYFFKKFIIYSKPFQNAIDFNAILGKFINKDYDPLPNEYNCGYYFPNDSYHITIKYSKTRKKYLDNICNAIACSNKLYTNWKLDFENKVKLKKIKSHYTYHLGDNKAHFGIYPYAYGEAPLGDGFYFTKSKINNMIYGLGYSYWHNTPADLEVASHEYIHHENALLFSQSPLFTSPLFLNKNFNEGLA